MTNSERVLDWRRRNRERYNEYMRRYMNGRRSAGRGGLPGVKVDDGEVGGVEVGEGDGGKEVRPGVEGGEVGDT